MKDDLIDYQKAYEEEQREKKSATGKGKTVEKIQQNTAMLQPIVDMNAYAQVVAKNYFQQEIEYRRLMRVHTLIMQKETKQT